VIFYLAVQFSLPSHRVAAAMATDEHEAAVQPELRTA
jgi:hypothetical protein